MQFIFGSKQSKAETIPYLSLAYFLLKLPESHAVVYYNTEYIKSTIL